MNIQLILIHYPQISGVTCGPDDDKPTASSKAQPQNGDSPTKFLDNSFSTDRYRSQLNVRLKLPNAKTNRSLENIFERSADVTQHNTSLPIIDSCGTTATKVTPLRMLSETTLSQPRNKKASWETRFNFNTLKSTLSHKLPYQEQEESTPGASLKKTVAEVGSDKCKRPETHQPVEENKVLKTHSVKEAQLSPEIPRNHNQNIFSKLPNGKFKCQNVQFLSTPNESTDSADLHLKTSPHLQNNPFMGNIATSTPNNAPFSSFSPLTIIPSHANPFISSSPNSDHAIPLQDIAPHDDQRAQYQSSSQLQHFQNPAILPSELTILTSSEQQRQIFLPLGTSNSRAYSPYCHTNASYSQNTHPSKIAVINNEAVYMPNSAPASFSGTPSSFPITNTPFSPNQSTVSLGTIPTSGLHQNNGLYHNPGYFLNSQMPSYSAQVSPTNTIMQGNTGYFLSNGANTVVPTTTHVPGNVAVIVPPPMSIPGNAEYVSVTSDLLSNTRPGSSCLVPPASFSVPDASSANASNFVHTHQNSDPSSDPLGHHSQLLASEGSKGRQGQSDVTENTLNVPRTQAGSEPASPVPNRKLTVQRKTSRKISTSSRQQSRSSGDEAPNLTPPTAHKHTNVSPQSASPGAGRRKISRKVSCTNSIGSHHNVDNSINENSAGSTAGPNATSSPNTKHRTSIVHHR
jgi:hypothetical protein